MNKITLFLFSVCFLSLSLYTNVNADSSSYTTYHLHSTTSTTATTTDYNTSLNTPDISNVMGGCYTEAVQHWHSSSCPQSRCSGWVDRDGADPYKDDYYWGFCTVGQLMAEIPKQVFNVVKCLIIADIHRVNFLVIEQVDVAKAMPEIDFLYKI